MIYCSCKNMTEVELTGTKVIDDIIYNYAYHAEHAAKYCKVMHQLKMRKVFRDMYCEMKQLWSWSNTFDGIYCLEKEQCLKRQKMILQMYK